MRSSSINSSHGPQTPTRALSPVNARPPTPLVWGKDKNRVIDEEDERPYTPVNGPGMSKIPVHALRTEGAGSTPMPVASRKRMPLEPAVNTPVAPTPTPKSPGATAPLSIQKKASLRDAPNTTRKGRGSPTSKTPARSGSLVRLDPAEAPTGGDIKASIAGTGSGDFTQMSKALLITAGATKEDIMSSRRAVKRIKIELDTINSGASRGQSRALERAGSMVRSPHSRNIASKADPKFEGLPSIVNRRAMFEAIASSEGTSKLSASTSADSVASEGWSKQIETIIAEAERHLIHAEAKHDRLIEQMQQLQNAPPTAATSSTEMERLKGELQRAKGQCELVKKLLTDATAEKEIMYETFNEELDAMYADNSLRDDEALVAMAEDLRRTKEARNDLSKENAQLKRKLAEMEFEKQHYEDMLRRHGLIS